VSRLDSGRCADYILRVVGRATAISLAALFAFGALACGSKTGLNVPDIESVPDAAVDVQPDAPRVCLEPGDASHPVTVDLTINAQIAVADILFVIDRTGSMDQEIDNIRQNLRSIIVPGLARSIPDLQLGVVTFADFPIAPYGAPEDVTFTLVQGMTREITAVQGALNGVRVGFGGDNPEALVEAIYQIATGEGLRSLGSLPDLIERSAGCPGPGTGYPCFRTVAQPILVVFTDAPSHNGPLRAGNWRCVPPSVEAGVSFPYSAGFVGYQAPHTYRAAVDALRSRVRGRIIGINSGASPTWGRDDLEQLACDTGAVGGDGNPLVFDVGTDGSGLGEQVVHAIGRFQSEVRFDVTARSVDLDPPGGTDLITAIRARSATPASQIRSMDGTTFFGVRPGTRLAFAIEIDPARAMRTEVEQVFRVRIEFLADGRPTLGSREIEIVIPGRGMMCPM